MEAFKYIGQVSLYWLLLYACYWLFLRHHTFFRSNRAYLLGSLLAAFALPLVQYPEAAPTLPVVYTVTAPVLVVQATAPSPSLFTWMNLLWLVYAGGVMVMGWKLSRYLIELIRFIRRGEAIEMDGYTLVLMNDDKRSGGRRSGAPVGSFSFLNWVVLSRSDYEHHFDTILTHELAHVQQRHSLDILLVEVLRVLFWFNPVLVLYKRSLQQVHEYLADQQAPNRDRYAGFLVSYALGTPVAPLANQFFTSSLLKDRIKMLYKNPNSRWSLGKYLAVATLTLFASLLVASCERDASKLEETIQKAPARNAATDKSTTEASFGVNGPVFTVVEEQPQFPGGLEAMYKFLGENIKYPEAAAKANVQGKVFLAFVVSAEGEIRDIQILKGLGYGADAESVRVLKQMPRWIPGKQSGQPVNVKYNLPINFQLEDKTNQVPAIPKADQSSSAIKGAQQGEPPLYVLNGVILKSFEEIQAINPNDIDAMNILKDKHATDKYGERGKVGVIEITTKKATSK
ncbi:TonB family protein [Telluribacter sp. SYSU D00476]|uniref:M56 family metallopeptidase n=1 Tax=Telluribacter sp. SYSU D00476 TaxID=2811430 RepID=UPI001FF14728|nr:M56 family metallopeptidase [Telluribacter sp. SYSU D00476]